MKRASRSNSLQKLDPGEFRGGAICDCFVYLLDFLLLLEADGPGSSYALAVSRLACGDALGFLLRAEENVLFGAFVPTSNQRTLHSHP